MLKCGKTYTAGKSEKNYYVFHELCNLWEGGQAEQVGTIKEELMKEIEENVNLNVMSILKEMWLENKNNNYLNGQQWFLEF